jgi:hypothetical protein
VASSARERQSATLSNGSHCGRHPPPRNCSIYGRHPPPGNGSICGWHPPPGKGIRRRCDALQRQPPKSSFPWEWMEKINIKTYVRKLPVAIPQRLACSEKAKVEPSGLSIASVHTPTLSAGQRAYSSYQRALHFQRVPSNAGGRPACIHLIPTCPPTARQRALHCQRAPTSFQTTPLSCRLHGRSGLGVDVENLQVQGWSRQAGSSKIEKTQTKKAREQEIRKCKDNLVEMKQCIQPHVLSSLKATSEFQGLRMTKA